MAQNVKKDDPGSLPTDCDLFCANCNFISHLSLYFSIRPSQTPPATPVFSSSAPSLPSTERLALPATTTRTLTSAPSATASSPSAYLSRCWIRCFITAPQLPLCAPTPTIPASARATPPPMYSPLWPLPSASCATAAACDQGQDCAEALWKVMLLMEENCASHCARLAMPTLTQDFHASHTLTRFVSV